MIQAPLKQNSIEDFSIQVAELNLNTVDILHLLHEQTRLKTGQNLRQKTPGDIHALVAKGELLAAWDQSRNAVGMLSIRRISHQERAAVLGLLADKAPGFVPPMANQTVEFNSFAISRSYAGQGIGSRLVTYGLEIAKSLGHRYALAKVWQENVGGQNTFKKAGFTQCATTHRPDGTPLLVFARPL